MKYIMWLILLLAQSISNSQVIHLTKPNGVVTLEAISDIDSLSAAVIHERILNWFGSSFNSAEAVITSNTPSKVVGTFIDGHNTGVGITEFDHRLVIDIKEGRIRVTITSTDMRPWLLKSNGTEWRTNYLKTKDRIEAKWNELYQTILESIRSNNDW